MDVARELRDFLKHYAKAHPTFEWGAADCFLFTASWYAWRTEDREPIDTYAGRYSTPLGALRHISKKGGAGFADCPDLVFTKMQHRDPAMVQRGNIVALDAPEEHQALGIYQGAGWCVFLGPDGFTNLRDVSIARAWEFT